MDNTIVIGKSALLESPIKNPRCLPVLKHADGLLLSYGASNTVRLDTNLNLMVYSNSGGRSLAIMKSMDCAKIRSVVISIIQSMAEA